METDYASVYFARSLAVSPRFGPPEYNIAYLNINMLLINIVTVQHTDHTKRF